MAFRSRYGQEPLDFSVNVTPLGTPPTVLRAAAESLAQSAVYPDPFCRELTQAIAEAEAVPPSNVWVGAGAEEVIYRAFNASRPKRALLVAPTFSEYERALRAAGAVVQRHYLVEENGFALGGSFLSHLRPDLDWVVLCEPNNPTGLTSPAALLHEVCDYCASHGVRLMVDESFNGFLEHPEVHSLAQLGKEAPELFVVKSLTKLYGLAGLRVGYGLCSDRHLMDALIATGPWWNVSTPAQAAATAALGSADYATSVRRLVAAERPPMKRRLESLGLRVIDGEANYLMFRSEKPLAVPLANQGILLRCCGDFEGLDDTWYRCAVRTADENSRLVTALESLLKE